MGSAKNIHAKLYVKIDGVWTWLCKVTASPGYSVTAEEIDDSDLCSEDKATLVGQREREITFELKVQSTENAVILYLNDAVENGTVFDGVKVSMPGGIPDKVVAPAVITQMQMAGGASSELLTQQYTVRRAQASA